MFIPNLLGFPDISMGMGSGDGSGGMQPIRVVTADNRINTTAEAQARTNQIVRWPIVIASGDASELIFSSTTKNLSGVASSAYTIVSMALEKNGTSLWAPVTFDGGSRSKVLAMEDNDVQSDPLYPDAFGQASFVRGEIYWVRAEISVAVSGNTIPTCANSTAQRTGSYVGWFNPGATTITNGVDSTGAITFTGTTPSSRASGYRPIVLGRFVSGDPKTMFVAGDSIFFGQGDTVVLLYGYGMAGRAMYDADLSSNLMACINFSRIGSASPDVVNNAWIRAYFKYTRILMDNYAANDFGNDGSGSTTTLKANLQSVWTSYKAASPIGQIIRTYIFPRTTSTDSFATSANQAVNANFVTKIPEMNQYFEDQKTAGVLSMVVGNSAFLNDPVDPLKWRTDGTTPQLTTTDGTHPSQASHVAKGGELRAAIATLN